jgi:hypothetical protein
VRIGLLSAALNPKISRINTHPTKSSMSAERKRAALDPFYRTQFITDMPPFLMRMRWASASCAKLINASGWILM